MSVVWIVIEPEDAVVHAYLLWVRIKHCWLAWFDLDFVDGHPKLLPFFLRRDAQTENKRHLLKLSATLSQVTEFAIGFASKLARKIRGVGLTFLIFKLRALSCGLEVS